MKKIFFGMFIFLNCILSFAYEKKVIYSDTQLSILCDSEDFLGEICNQYYVKPGSFVTIKYKLNKYHSSGYDAVAGIGGAGGYYDEFYINKDIINTSQNVAISSEQIIEKELDKDITVALYRVRYSNSSSDSYECLSSITLRTSIEFYAKISNHNQGILYETKYPSGGCFDLFISIPKEGWCLCDLGICVRKNEFIEYKFEKKEVQYIDYVGKVGDTILEKGTQKIKVVNDFDIVVVKKISPPRGSLKEEELFTKKITVDGTAPEIEIKPSWEGKEWIQEDVEISAIDVKTGIKSFVVKKDGEEYKNNESGGNILLTEEGRYFITALDLVGNKKEIEINIDKTFPRITVNREPVKEDILYSDSIITIKAEDYGSGVAEFCVNGNTITGSEYTLTKSGNYTIFVKDKAGNESTRTIKIDNEKPTVTGRIEFKQENGSIKKIEIVDVKGEDKHSGIENTWVKNGTSTIGGEIKIEDRTKLNTYQIQIGAKDKAGNQVEKELAVINVPPKIKVSVDEESKRIIKENGEEYTATDLILDNYEKYAKY